MPERPDFFHRYRSRSHSLLGRSPSPAQPQQTVGPGLVIFQGTDAVENNRRVALQRINEINQAFELQHNIDTSSERPGSSSAESSSSGMSTSSTTSDAITIDFRMLPVADAELQAFRYLVRLWDPTERPDDEFDSVIAPCKAQFEDAAIKHFIRRIASWDGENDQKPVTRPRRLTWRRKERSHAENAGMTESVQGQVSCLLVDELKMHTTKEGLAQLLWTLMRDPNKKLAPKLSRECTDAVKRMYGIRM